MGYMMSDVCHGFSDASHTLSDHKGSHTKWPRNPNSMLQKVPPAEIKAPRNAYFEGPGMARYEPQVFAICSASCFVGRSEFVTQ